MSTSSKADHSLLAQALQRADAFSAQGRLFRGYLELLRAADEERGTAGWSDELRTAWVAAIRQCEEQFPPEWRRLIDQ